MRLLTRLLGAVTLILCIVGILGGIAAIIFVWTMHHRAAPVVDKGVKRLEVALARAATLVDAIDRALKQARINVDGVRQTSSELGPDAQKNKLLVRTVLRAVNQELGPKVDDVSERVVTFSELAVVANTVLEG